MKEIRRDIHISDKAREALGEELVDVITEEIDKGHMRSKEFTQSVKRVNEIHKKTMGALAE